MTDSFVSPLCGRSVHATCDPIDAQLLARYRVTISTAAGSAAYLRNTPRMGYIGASVSDVHANSIRYGIATASDCIRCIHLHLADILHGGDFPYRGEFIS